MDLVFKSSGTISVLVTPLVLKIVIDKSLGFSLMFV